MGYFENLVLFAVLLKYDQYRGEILDLPAPLTPSGSVITIHGGKHYIFINNTGASSNLISLTGALKNLVE